VLTISTEISHLLRPKISTNYAWLPHNVDPANNPVPKVFENMPVQPLGDRQKIYNDHLAGCRAYYGEQDGHKCDVYEYDRMLMNQRQPQRSVLARKM
jgi:hypothetical protein